MGDILQNILDLMSELRPEWSTESLRESVNHLMAMYNASAKKKIGEVQAADIFFIESEYLYELITKSEFWISHDNNEKEDLLSLDKFLQKAESLFGRIIDEFQVLWLDPKSSILSYLPGVSEYLPELVAPSFDMLHSLITKNAKSRILGNFKSQSVIWSIYDYILYALTGRRGKPYSTIRMQRESATEWILSDLRNQSIPENDNYYGYAILRNILSPSNKLNFDESTSIRKSSKFEWRELLLSEQKYNIKENTLVNEVNYLHLHELDSLCLLETILPDSSRSEFVGEMTLESMTASMKTGERIRNRLYDAVSCMRLVIHPKIGLAFLNHTGVHIESSPLSPMFRPEYYPPPDFYREITGAIVPEVHHYMNFKMRRDEESSLIEFWKKFWSFRYDITKTDFHKNYERALTRFNQACTEYYIEDAIIDLVISMEIMTQGVGAITSYRIAGFISPDDKIQTVQKIINGFLKLRNEYVHGSISNKNRSREILQTLSLAQVISRAFLRNVIFYCIEKGPPTGKHEFRNVLDSYIIDCNEREDFHNLVPKWSKREISELQDVL